MNGFHRRALKTGQRLVRRQAGGKTITLRERERSKKKFTSVEFTCLAVEQDWTVAMEKEFKHLTAGEMLLLLPPFDIDGQPLPATLDEEASEWVGSLSTRPGKKLTVRKVVRQQPGPFVVGYLLVAG